MLLPLVTGDSNDFRDRGGAIIGLSSPLEGLLNDFPDEPGVTNRLSSPLPDPLNDLAPALGATGRLSMLRAVPSRPLLSSTLLEKMDSALFLASGDLNPSFLNVLFLVSGITVRG